MTTVRETSWPGDLRPGTTPARSNLGASWRRACVAADVPQVRLHDLRHIAQVYAAEAGATLPELMARLGHATSAAAMVYLHARNDRDVALAAALGEAMAVPPGAGGGGGGRP